MDKESIPLSTAIIEAEKKPPLPSIGSNEKKVKAKKETADADIKKAKHPRKKSTDAENQIEKESTTASSSSKNLKKSKKKKAAREWNRYFAFINDKEREKLMKLPEIENKIEKSKSKIKARSKSAKKSLSHPENDLNERIRSKSVDFSEEVKIDNKAMTSTPKQTDSKIKESSDLERITKQRKKKTNSILGNFNFNVDLDQDEKRKKPANIGYNYYRSQSSKRMQCKPQLIDEFDEFTLADEFNTLKFRTSQTNIMRSMRANL